MIRKKLIEVQGKSVVRVTFSLPSSTWTCRLNLVGDFNNWNRTSHPLQQDDTGRWTITIDLEPGRTFEFRYLYDGKDWMNDSQADGDVPNPYGGSNSLIVTEPVVRARAARK